MVLLGSVFRTGSVSIFLGMGFTMVFYAFWYVVLQLELVAQFFYNFALYWEKSQRHRLSSFWTGEIYVLEYHLFVYNMKKLSIL